MPGILSKYTILYYRMHTMPLDLVRGGQYDETQCRSWGATFVRKAMLQDYQPALRALPSVESVLNDEQIKKASEAVPHKVVVDAARFAVDEMRGQILAGACGSTATDEIRNAVVSLCLERIRWAMGPHYRKAINATGIILHTGLGRAVLPKKAVGQIARELSGYSVLQVDIEEGKRSQRDARIEWLMRQLTGCEAATVVNNNAAATSIVLNTFAKGKEVIVSRGQLVEIGGSFRLPDVMAASGAKLVEVGTTNKTHAADYAKAITENTAAIMRVHPSNYRVVGFTAEVPLDALVKIAHDHHVMLIDDLGAGALLDFSRFGFEPEPMLADSIKAGADIVTCSADKLIGGSQGGIILGKKEYVEAVRKNPLARIVRVGKLTLAALEATLALFLDEDEALREVPTLRMLSRDLADLEEQAERIVMTVKEKTAAPAITTTDGNSQMGSGSLPGQNLPTRLVSVSSQTPSVEEIAARLRRNNPPVFARIQKDELLLDPRTLLEGEEEIVIEALIKALSA